jgi:predicted DNA-binding transcriptional regulator AlpA
MEGKRFTLDGLDLPRLDVVQRRSAACVGVRAGAAEGVMANLAPFGKRLTLQETASALGISRAALYRLVRERRITYVQERTPQPGKRGSNYFFYEHDIQTYLAAQLDAVTQAFAAEAARVEATVASALPPALASDVSDLLPVPSRRRFA